ncbi:MAG: MarR family winged helix-turn-helix transcriptional regulator [Sporolactobacillus sp.]
MDASIISKLILDYENVSIFATNKVQEVVTEFLGQYQLTFEQLHLLKLIAGNPKITPVQITRLLGINKSGVSIRLNRLINKGFIEKKPIDRRSHGLFITSSGRQIYNSADEKIHELVNQWIQELGEADSKAFIRIYQKINQIIVKQKAGEKNGQNNQSSLDTARCLDYRAGRVDSDCTQYE